MNCTFCNHKKIEQETIESTENFFIVPALGSFVPYYFLIISRFHADSIGSTLNSNEIVDEFKKIKSKIEKFITSKTGGEYICFEHGGSSPNTSGCCVGHAHLHILPSKQTYLETIKKTLGEPEMVEYEKINQKEDHGYLLLEEKRQTYYWPNPHIISQFMRRLIAQKQNIADKYDWKIFPFQGNIKKTVLAWKNWID